MGIDADSESVSPPAGAEPSAWNLPNILSIGRVALIAISAVFYLSGFRVVGLALAAVAGVSDLVDGWLARRLNMVTDLGATLDRLGDLAFESTALAVLTGYGMIPIWVLVAYQLREFIMLSVRITAVQRGVAIASTWLGKIKTDAICLGCLGPFLVHAGVLDGEAGEWAATIGRIAIYVGIAFSYASFAQYLRRAALASADK